MSDPAAANEQVSAILNFAVNAMLALLLLAAIGYLSKCMWRGSFTAAGARKLQAQCYHQQISRYVRAADALVDAGGGQCSLAVELGTSAEGLAAELAAVGATEEIARRGYQVHLLPDRWGVVLRVTPIRPTAPRRAALTVVINKPLTVLQTVTAEHASTVTPEPSATQESWELYSPGERRGEDERPSRRRPARWPRLARTTDLRDILRHARGAHDHE